MNFGIDEVFYIKEIEPFEEKFEEIVKFFYQQNLITKQEYLELLKKLKESRK